MISLNDQLTELADTFRKEKGFDRLFSFFLEKYRSYERLEKQISVTIDRPTVEEKNALGGLLSKDYSKSKKMIVTASQFEKALRKTKFAQVLEQYKLADIVQSYYGRQLVSKREEKAAFLTEREAFFAKYAERTESLHFKKLLDWIRNEGNEQNRFYQLFRQDRVLLAEILDDMMAVCEALPLQEYTYLPVFSAGITNDPHALDMHRETGKYFIYTLQILQGGDEETLKFDLNAEETAQLLYEFKILKDDLLNYVTLFNMAGTLHNGKESLLLEGARADQASFHLPLREVVKLKSVRAASPNNMVYMIENSAVSSHVINRMIQEKINCSIIAGNGMLNIATLRFLDMLTESEGAVYYAGDFDPEGLGIAQKLLRRYGRGVRLWMYGAEDYIRSVSERNIDPHRLKQLSQIDHPELTAVKNEMLKRQKAGYQENILNEMTANIAVRSRCRIAF